VYADPVVTVSRVTLEVKEAKRLGTVVALAVDNRNTYAISAERVELSLRLERFEQKGAMMFGEGPSSSAP